MATFIWSQEGHSDYFYDQGFLDADFRTDFNSKTEGDKNVNELTYSSHCIFPPPNPIVEPWSVCGTSPDHERVAGDYWYQSSSSVWNANANFWVLSVNNEPAFDGTLNAGVPNQAHKLYSNTSQYWMYTPAAFAVVTDTEIGENFPRAHLIVRHLTSNHSLDPNGAGGIPFLSIGGQDDRGHSDQVGEMGYSATGPHTVKFKARIWDFIEPDPSTGNEVGLFFFMYAMSEWDGKKRGIFITLKHIGDNSDWTTGVTDVLPYFWNWPIEESFFHPGVDWRFIDSEDFGNPATYPRPSTVCNISPSLVPQMVSTGVDYQFTLDLEELFRCANARYNFTDPLPTDEALPITGVHWGVEMFGTGGAIWSSVHDMKMQ